MPSFDVNWLLATLAQSSAALVAIVGGFLIARVIDLASRRDQLRARINSLSADLGIQRQSLDRLKEAIVANSAMDVFYDHSDDLIDTDESSQVDEILSQRDSGLDAAVITEVHSSVEQARHAREELGRLMRDGHPLPDLSRLRAQGELTFNDDDAWLWETVYDYLASQHEPPAQGAGTFAMPGLPHIPRIPSDVVSRKRHIYNLENRAADIEHQLHSVTAQRRTAEDELVGLRAPREMRTGAWVLVYFSVVGVAAPVTVMMTGQTALDWWVRLLLVVGFLSALGALMWFLFHVIRGVDEAGK